MADEIPTAAADLVDEWEGAQYAVDIDKVDNIWSITLTDSAGTVVARASHGYFAIALRTIDVALTV